MTTTHENGKRVVTLIPGDGIGAECVDAAKNIIEATGAPIAWDVQHAGASIFKQGLPSGVPQETIDSLIRTRVALKGPLETPIGFGEKSANVTLRKLFETYSNVRPVREMPGVMTPYSGRGIDLVIVRENVEDLYAGIEYMQTPGVAQCLKLISRKGCEKIVRFAFELARAEGRKTVHCATKSNIMKMTEGLLKRTFEEIAQEYSDIESHHIIIDNCAHQLVKKPEQFDVICTTNMNGDIISDLTSALVGGLGFAPSANIGADFAIFEAVHGSAPKYAGKNVINPTAVIMSAVMMLRFLQMFKEAAAIEHAVLVTLEDGKVRTRDTVDPSQAASTTDYTAEIIKNLGRKSSQWVVRDYKPLNLPPSSVEVGNVRVNSRKVVGYDLFIESPLPPLELGKSLDKLVEGSSVRLKTIAARGTMVYPSMGTVTDCVDHYSCRFMSRSNGNEMADADLVDLIQRIAHEHKWMHVEKLQEFDGEPTFSRSQGED